MTKQSPPESASNQPTLDSILEEVWLAAVENGYPYGTKADFIIAKAKAELNTYMYETFLELLGEYETDDDEVLNELFYATRNGLKDQLRQAAAKRFNNGLPM